MRMNPTRQSVPQSTELHSLAAVAECKPDRKKLLPFWLRHFEIGQILPDEDENPCSLRYSFSTLENLYRLGLISWPNRINQLSREGVDEHFGTPQTILCSSFWVVYYNPLPQNHNKPKKELHWSPWVGPC